MRDFTQEIPLYWFRPLRNARTKAQVTSWQVVDNNRGSMLLSVRFADGDGSYYHSNGRRYSDDDFSSLFDLENYEADNVRVVTNKITFETWTNCDRVEIIDEESENDL